METDGHVEPAPTEPEKSGDPPPEKSPGTPPEGAGPGKDGKQGGDNAGTIPIVTFRDTVDRLEKRVSDKDTHIVQLETELRELRGASEGKQGQVAEDDVLWITQNSQDLIMVRTEFEGYRRKGYSRDDALRLAKLDKGLLGKQPDPHAQRQAASSGEPPTVTRGPDEPVEITETDRRLSISPEVKKKHRAQVEG